MLQKLKLKAQQARDDVRYFGVGTAARNLLLWALRKVITYRVAIVYGADVAQLTGAFASSSDLTFCMEPASKISRELLDAADISAGTNENIFVVRSGAEIAFVARVSTGSFTIPKRHIVAVPEGGVYVSCCYTQPSFRGRGLYGIGVSQIATLYRDTATRVFLYVELENAASTRAVLKMGFKPLARSSIVSWGPFTARKFGALSGDKFPAVSPA